jgi:hypothetical protein
MHAYLFSPSPPGFILPLPASRVLLKTYAIERGRTQPPPFKTYPCEARTTSPDKAEKRELIITGQEEIGNAPIEPPYPGEKDKDPRFPCPRDVPYQVTREISAPTSYSRDNTKKNLQEDIWLGYSHI